MKNIVLFCAAGMSTSLLVNKMKEAAEEQGLDYQIAAYPLSEADTLKAGDRVYTVNRGKGVIAAVIGEEDIEKGILIPPK